VEYFLPILFFFVSFFYSSVGLGGGSSYTAIMAIMGINYQLIPATSLTLNLGVTFIGMINFWKAGYGRINLIAPFLITSIPMSYLAGSVRLPELMFQIILTMTLLLVVSRIYFFDRLAFTYQLSNIEKWLLAIFLGSFLGFIAGAVGIGGGIYLVPLIITFGLGTTKEASAAGAMFVWFNSFAGLLPRLQSGVYNIKFIIPLVFAVLLGGFVGSYFGSVRFESIFIQKIIGALIILAIIFLIQRIL
tara:strand:+ start:2351 stop:3088 length:738 start_codon:yes stop_codon:yes gene_type:complete